MISEIFIILVAVFLAGINLFCAYDLLRRGKVLVPLFNITVAAFVVYVFFGTVLGVDIKLP